MEGMCGFHSIDDYNTDKVLLSSPECNLLIPTTTTTTIDHGYSDDQNLLFSAGDRNNNFSPFRSDFNDLDDSFHLQQCRSGISESSSEIHPFYTKRASQEQEKEEEDYNCSKAKIASHPFYPKLLHAYIDCQKVGAPPEIACLLDEIKEESGFCRRRDGGVGGSVATTCLGADPELDDFMETYCEILVKYKLDLERPFDEATTFLNKIEMQLTNLGKDDSSEEDEYYTYRCSRGGGGGVDNTEEQVELGLRNQEEDREIKERLLRKYGDHLSALKLEFSKKKKKGKLPKESRLTLLQWWNAHYKWPYPTEADKVRLAELTGLDQKQINNWFINQRKRHWKPSDNMQFDVMGNCSGQHQFIDHYD